DNMLMSYPKQANFAELNLLYSNDVSRFFSVCGEDLDKMELCILLQMTFPGMPCVFYGDEQGLTGVTEPEYRRPMIFEDKSPLFEVYKKLIKLRTQNKALRYGEFRTIASEGGLYGFKRIYRNDEICVYINSGSNAVNLETSGDIIASKLYDNNVLNPHGYAVIRK
ncbi:MAG: hypothetical protein IKZ94_08640, partial [Lachnospiraceae bacterium]|nr:hypothetical protein [Lachnospiraceae bacterium]